VKVEKHAEEKKEKKKDIRQQQPKCSEEKEVEENK